MDRVVDFYNDSEIGEEDFISYAQSRLGKHYSYFELVDVRYDNDFQALDIDFVIYLDSNYKRDDLLRDIRCGNPEKRNVRIQTKAMAFEVKTDTRTHGTRNFVYELVSHGMPGCMARCYADFIYYVSTNRVEDSQATKEGYKIEERHIINVWKWRLWLLNKESKYSVNSISNDRDLILNFLCNVEVMVEDGAAKKLMF